MNPDDNAHISDQGYDVASVDDYDSGSSYRASSESAGENRRGRRKLRGLSRRVMIVVPAENGDLREAAPTPTIISKSTDHYTKERAAQWAESFEPSTRGNSNVNKESNASPNSRKRRPSSSAYEVEASWRNRHLRGKKFKSSYNDGYRQLLNDDIKNAASSSLPSDYPPLSTSEIGCSTWTPVEKEAFFTAIGRLGKDNIPGIATLVGSKSKLQVREYIDLLQRCHNLKKPLAMTDIPAAFEVSEECCRALGDAGEALSVRQERYEETLERAKWGDDSWLLTEDVNEWVESHLAEPGGELTVAEVLPAAQLLNLGNWLEISTRVFMNPAEREDENWRSLIQDGEQHGIRATAFSDFQNLTISITKRLISASLFCAMSRLRSKDMDIKDRQEAATSADVEAATQIIGLSLNSHEFWKCCPRRNNLQIFQRLNNETNPPMDFDEVESRLNKPTPSLRSRSRSNLDSASRVRASSVSTINATDVDLSSDEEIEAGPNASGQVGHIDYPAVEAVCNRRSQSQVDHAHGYPQEFPSSQPLSLHPTTTQTVASRVKALPPESRQLAYAENSDILASMAEEARLWTLLKQKPPFLTKDEVKLPQNLKVKPQVRADMLDWRERVEYWSPWETHDTLPVEDTFVSNRRIANKRRKLVRDESEDDERELVADAGAGKGYDEDSETEEQLDSDSPYPEEAAMVVDQNFISRNRGDESENDDSTELNNEGDDDEAADKEIDIKLEADPRGVANDSSDELWDESQ